MEKEQGEHLLPRTSREGLRVPNIRIDDSDPEDYSHYQQPASLTSQTLRWKWAGVTCAAMLASLTLGYVLGHTANLTSEGRSGSGRTQYVDGFPCKFQFLSTFLLAVDDDALEHSQSVLSKLVIIGVKIA